MNVSVCMCFMSVRTSPNVPCTLYVAMARSSFGGFAILHVFPVLWITSCLHMKITVAIDMRKGVSDGGITGYEALCLVEFWRLNVLMIDYMINR